VKAFSLLRFFFAKDQEMTCRHAQWRDKEISQHKTREDLESSNPAMTQTANARTWQPGTAPDR